MFNPYINSRKFLAGYLTAWFFAIATNFALALYLKDFPFYNIQLYSLKDILIDEITHDIVLIIMGISFWYPALFIKLNENSFLKILVKHLIIAIVALTLWLGVSYVICAKIIGFSKEYYDFYLSSFFFRIFGGFFAYTVITVINYVIIYYKISQEKEIAGTKLQSMLAEAELKTLKYQINPHFIFNSLNSISSLTISEPVKAREMTIKLSEFLRGTLSKSDKQFTPFSEEIKNITLYMDIEKIRFQDKFEFIKEIPDEFLTVNIPGMILQPLVENAIKHGVYESLDKIIIQLRAEKSGNYLKIDLINNYDCESVSRKGEGIGINNVKNRLKLIYNHDNLLTISDNKQFFQVTIYIPLEVQL